MTGIPPCDYHIHTRHLGCANGTMEVPAIVRECERIGVHGFFRYAVILKEFKPERSQHAVTGYASQARQS